MANMQTKFVEFVPRYVKLVQKSVKSTTPSIASTVLKFAMSVVASARAWSLRPILKELSLDTQATKE